MTKLHVHELPGLKPDTLATYLAALGVLRLLAEHEHGDATTRGFWRNEHFVLVSELDWAAIERFFLEDYEPTPILAPWNMESGFFSLKPTDGESEAPDEALDDGSEAADAAPAEDDEQAEEDGDETDQAVGDPRLDRFACTSAQRFASYRRATEMARAAIPSELRDAEADARRAHDEVKERSAEERTKHEEALKQVSDAKSGVAELKAEIEAKKTAVKGVARGAPEHEALKEAQERVKAAREQQKALQQRAKELEKNLKLAEKRAKADEQLKKRIVDAKAYFTAIQKKTKARLIAQLRASWGVEGQQWVDAAVALDEKGAAGFTSLFGSGGNDGRMEYTKNLRYHLEALFDVGSGDARNDTAAKLKGAIFGTPTNLLDSKAVGQFFPGRAGGTNMGAGFSGGAGINPWEFVLMLEGAVALVAGMSRRGDIEKAHVSSPFWVNGASAGFGSASEREDSPRGEQWLPLWSQPLCYDELVELIREGRAQVGRRQTTRAADLVRATARLGLARGIDSLRRFAYLERNGQSNLAVSTGRFRVASRPHQALLDEVAPWIDWLGGQAREKNAPTSLGVIARRAQEALFTVCRQEATATMWRGLLVTLGDAELALLRAGKNPARRPLPPLSSGWVMAVDDGTQEGRTALRLALALASQHSPREQENAPLVDSVRRHFLPLVDGDKPRPWFKLDEKGRVLRDPEHVCVGRDLVTDAIALVERRSIWARSSSAKRERARRLPLEAARGCEATPEEIAAWVRGEVADEGVLRLVRPLLAVDWGEVAQRGSGMRPQRGGVPDPVQMLFRLAHLPFDVPVQGSVGRTEAEVTVRLDPEPLRRLAGGDLDGALKIAIRRLDASGLRPVFRRGIATPALARRLAASLAFPISRDDAARAARLVCKPYDVKDAQELLSTPV
ncbi:MAG: type I-U CRISPR-associated protein Csx17 [Deltaproteobacteria bacterium]|nr:type I-U CRISPR-associated protein Csx17 [Deltaproteobacteria bacterium]